MLKYYQKIPFDSHTARFHPQTQKLELPYKPSIIQSLPELKGRA